MLTNSLLAQKEITAYIKQLVAQKKLVAAGDYIISPESWQKWAQKLLDSLEAAHKADPLKQGALQAALQAALGLPKDVFDALTQNMAATGKLARQEDTLFLPQNKPALSPQQEATRKAIFALFAKNPTAPPTLKELGAQLPGGAPVAHFMIKQGKLV